jgi:hypothetical protein
MIRRIVSVSLLMLLLVGCARKGQVGAGHADAEPVFPERVVGYYAVPMSAFSRVAAAGFNVVHTYRFESHWEPDAAPFVAAAREYLDEAQRHDLQVMLGIPRNWLRRQHDDVVRAAIRQLRNHTAILAWYEDELGQEGDVEAVELLSRVVRQEDPDRGLVIEEGKDLAALRSIGKARMFTYYPVDHKSRRRGRLRTIRERFPVDGLQVPFIPALQTFGRDRISGYEKRDLEAPTWPELQFTLYSSLMAGADGIFLYTYLHSTRYDVELKKKDQWPYVEAQELPVVAPDMWESAQQCVAEARILFDLLAEATPMAGLRLEGDSAGCDVAAWNTPRGTLVLLSNATYTARSLQLRGLAAPQAIKRLHHDRWGPTESVDGSELRVVLPGPGGVCLLAIGNKQGSRSTATPEFEGHEGTDRLRVGDAGL